LGGVVDIEHLGDRCVFWAIDAGHVILIQKEPMAFAVAVEVSAHDLAKLVDAEWERLCAGSVDIELGQFLLVLVKEKTMWIFDGEGIAHRAVAAEQLPLIVDVRDHRRQGLVDVKRGDPGFVQEKTVGRPLRIVVGTDDLAGVADAQRRGFRERAVDVDGGERALVKEETVHDVARSARWIDRLPPGLEADPTGQDGLGDARRLRSDARG
jgi:hypothetical protein